MLIFVTQAKMLLVFLKFVVFLIAKKTLFITERKKKIRIKKKYIYISTE